MAFAMLEYSGRKKDITRRDDWKIGPHCQGVIARVGNVCRINSLIDSNKAFYTTVLVDFASRVQSWG